MNRMIPLLSEELRPQSLFDLTLTPSVLASLQRSVTSGSILNYLFYGPPGVGKTSAARIIVRELDADIYELNGSHNSGDKTMVNQIELFASSVSLLGKAKVCFIDEADHMSKPAQAALRYVIENHSSRVRFLMTANDLKGVTPAIQSRCRCVSFDVLSKDRATVIDVLVARYERFMATRGIGVEQKRLRELVSSYFPDMRSIANALQDEYS